MGIIVFSLIIPTIIYYNMDRSFLRFVLVGISSVALSSAVIFFMGLSKSMQDRVLNKAYSIALKIIK